MPIQPINLPRFSFDEINPLLTGYGKGLDYANTNTDMVSKYLEQSKARAQLPYAGLTSLANAGSKLAYANLMAPQFIAKLMQNPSFVANLTEEQKNNLKDMIYRAGTGQGTGAGQFNPFVANYLPQPQPGQNNGGFVNNPSLPNYLPSSPNNQGYANNPNLSAQDRNSINNMKPGDFYVVQGNQNMPQTNNKTYAENAGEYQGTVEEGKKLGEVRANAIEDFGNQYQDSLQAKVPITHLMELTQNPTFMNMRNKVPFFQDYQLKALSKIGTPEEQKLIGDFTTSATKTVADTLIGFRGRILDKEVTMANQMKVSPNDTWNTMIGKLSSVATFNEILGQRAKIAAQLMEKQHLNKVDALEEADKMVNGKAIRDQINNQLNPKPTDEDVAYMANKYHLDPAEVKKRLNKKGYKMEIQLGGEK